MIPAFSFKSLIVQQFFNLHVLVAWDFSFNLQLLFGLWPLLFQLVGAEEYTDYCSAEEWDQWVSW